MIEQAYRFAGWFLIDVRLAVVLSVFSAALSVLVLALFFKGRRWDEYVVGFIALFCLTLLGTAFLTNWLSIFPALRVETFFPVP